MSDCDEDPAVRSASVGSLGQDVHTGLRFREFKHLGKAYDNRQRILEKTGLTPAKYPCAAQSCAFRSLKACQCAGSRCAHEVKPSYCSKQCQIRVSLRR